MDITYFQVLFYFIFPPLIVLTALRVRDIWVNRTNNQNGINWLPLTALITHVFLAVIYSTPWDNYLVANGVWWYDENLVTGRLIGYVPIEEYTFFVVQTLMTGMWILTLWRVRDLQPLSDKVQNSFRRWSILLTTILWVASVVVLVAGWQPARYLALILVWALIPLIIQFSYGADILWKKRAQLLLAILPATIYLWIVDAIAIYSGVWTIDPMQTLGIKIGPLPIEEMVFFLVTNMMISFGITLMIAPESTMRISQFIKRISLVFGWKRKMV